MAPLFLALVITGCATGSITKAFTVPPDQVAFLTVARPSTLGFCCTIPLLVNDREVARLGAGEYATVQIPAGRQYPPALGPALVRGLTRVE